MIKENCSDEGASNIFLWLAFNQFQAASHLYLAATYNLAAYLCETTAVIGLSVQKENKSLILTALLIPLRHSNGLRAVTDNSLHLENQTKLQHSCSAPGTAGHPEIWSSSQFRNIKKANDLRREGKLGARGVKKTQQSLGDEWDFNLDSIAAMHLTIRHSSSVSFTLDAGGKILTKCLSQY